RYSRSATPHSFPRRRSSDLETFYVRELARLTGVPAGSLHRELKLLTGAGLLRREPAGNQVRYRVDIECPVYEDLAAIFRKTAGRSEEHTSELQSREKLVCRL